MCLGTLLISKQFLHLPRISNQKQFLEPDKLVHSLSFIKVEQGASLGGVLGCGVGWCVGDALGV
jgi:hypothetical protein